MEGAACDDARLGLASFLSFLATSILDRALALLAAARRVDPDRRGYAYWEFAYLAGARRWSPRSAPVRCIVGVAISSVHGDLYLERTNGKYASTGPERLREDAGLARDAGWPIA